MMRRKNPTNSAGISASTARKRRMETIDAATAIHGSSSENYSAATVGLVQTLDKKCSVDSVVDSLKSCKRFKSKVIPKVYKQDLNIFESSTENMLRSIAVYYSKGVMGRAKYRSVYKASSFRHSHEKKKAVRISVTNCPVPKLVPYHRLMSYIKSIDIGKLFSVRDTLCDGLDESEKVNGCYRDLEELLVRLAEFYLNNDFYELLDFGEANTFHIALGGDGAPFGKDETACAWLVSFLNIGKGVLSSNENFLLFGANCPESCVPVSRFIQKVTQAIQKITNTTYSVVSKGDTVNVKFVFSELPNDMKMLAYLGGELSNSAKYFSSFADVCMDSILANRTGTFSKESGSVWKPWEYNYRLKVAKNVEELKKEISGKKLANSTKRSKITSFISKQISRQEFPPLIGQLIDQAHVEPLHLKNNVCALAHRHLLNQAIQLSNISSSVSSFSQLPPGCSIVRYVEALKSKCFLSRLAKKIVRWFNDTGAKKNEFDYRFTGRDSRFFLYNFMFLIDILEQFASDRPVG